MKILIINGPNLNLLGKRNQSIYGAESLDELNNYISRELPDFKFDFYQNNSEGELISRIQDGAESHQGIIVNPGAFTHYSFALRDAIEAVEIPVIEVHLSNIDDRETFRRKSVVSSVCSGTISGLGKFGYLLAAQAIFYLTSSKHKPQGPQR